MPVTLRPATPADRALLERWDDEPHVLASDPNDDWGWETELARDPDWREQLIAELDGRPIGFVQIIDPAREDSHYWENVGPNLRAVDLWIGEAGDLGKGYGTQMMRLALARCFADPAVVAVLVDPLAANVRAHRFYERLGFHRVGPRRFNLDDCMVYRLERGTVPESPSRRDAMRPKWASDLNKGIHQFAEGLGNLLTDAFHYLALFAIGAAVVWSAGHEFFIMAAKGRATIEDVLLLFIYLELGAMVGIYFKTNHMPVRFLIYVGITALTRLLISDIQDHHRPGMEVIYATSAILILALATLVVRFGSARYPSPRGDDATRVT